MPADRSTRIYRRARRWIAAVALSAVLPILTGCAMSIPTDPNGTLDQVRDGSLRVGASPSEGWVDLDGDTPSGVDVELVEGFADSLHSDIRWQVGGEEALIGQLERGDLDLVIGGLTDESPWIEQAAITTPFIEVAGEDGSRESHVLAAPLGENAFLLALETFLLSQKVEAP